MTNLEFLDQRLVAIAVVRKILDEIDAELGNLEHRYREEMRADLDMLARYVRACYARERKDAL